MKWAHVCYAKYEDRELRDDRALRELVDLGYRRLPGYHAYFEVSEEQLPEIQKVLDELNERHGGSLWLCSYEPEKKVDRRRHGKRDFTPR